MEARFSLLLGCFFLSGFAALVYQTAWTRELSFVFGTSDLAVAAVLAAYMGGLALGAAAAARFALRLRRPVLIYGVLELAIALCALSVPAGIRVVSAVYVGLLGGGSDLPDNGSSVAALFQLAAAFAVLLPPTAFMGATLPLLARHAVRSEAQIGSRVGVLYAVNTAGAIAGTLCAAFWLMPEFGLRRTVWAGAALNGAVFALAALLARNAEAPPTPDAARAGRATPATAAAAWILPAIAASGAVSFVYEVLWTRLLGHLLGASLHAFATMLGSFLLGIALGSALAARLATSRVRAVQGFGWAQLGIATTSYAAFAFSDRLPEVSHALGAGPASPLASAALAAATLLPITLCIGTTFPFAVRLLARHPQQAAAATARVYAWNTVGAIVGALGAGFVLLPGLGFPGTLSVGVAANLGLAALTALAARPRRVPLAALAAAAGVALVALPLRQPWALLTASPLTTHPEPGEIVYAAVGRSSSVLLTDVGPHFHLSTNGLAEARIERDGLLLQGTIARWLGLLPALVRPEARDILVVGLGGGMALEPVPSTIESIDVIELEPEVLAANQRVAALRAVDPLSDPRVRVHIGDARGALRLTRKRYDAIVSQPSHPWTAGASHLYTREFFSLVRAHLSPEGVFVQWIGLRFVDEALLRSLVATLVEVFTHVELYQPRAGGLLFAASDAPLDAIEGAERALRAASKDYARLGIHRVEDFAAARLLDTAGARTLAAGAALNTDDHNLLAARASQLGEASLDARALHALVVDLDPLLAERDGPDFSALIRRLLTQGLRERATSLVSTREGAAEELGLGWIELGFERRERAARHFARALSLDPNAGDARAGLVASRRGALTRGLVPPEIEGVDLEDGLTATITGWRLAAASDWESVAALDAQLASIEPGDALFEEASRLRVGWRLAADDLDKSAEALAILEALLSRQWHPRDALQRARAAIAAGRPTAAWGALQRIARDIPSAPQTRPVVQAALEIAESLPEEARGDVRRRLERRIHPTQRNR